MRTTGLLVAAIAVHCLIATAHAEDGATSRAVEKDGIAASISIANRQVNADGQPTLTIRFENKSRDYLNLYDVASCWKWRMAFTKLDAAEGPGKNLRLQFDVIHDPNAIVFKQIKLGENCEVTIDLENDPPFTFSFVGDAEHGKTPSPVRHLKPGKYEVKATITLENPFGNDGHMWTGPITTEPVQFTVVDRMSRAIPSAKDLAAYDKALQPVITLTSEKNGLWTNGSFPNVKLGKDADPEDVVAAVVNVNRSNIGTKAYHVLRIKRLDDEGGKRFVALISAGKSTKALLCFPISEDHWWSRAYDATIKTTDPAKSTETPGK